MKKQQPLQYESIYKSLHLPQYLSFLITGIQLSDMTSIGCHTTLWDFKKKDYHDWVYTEKIDDKLAPIQKGDEVTEITYNGNTCISGIGLHDSSAALIPYLKHFTQPFVLISTGTWCITLNPFNHNPLTEYELRNDCLTYITYEGLPVKASRLFAGYEHEQQVQHLAVHFSKPVDYYKQVAYNSDLIKNATDSIRHLDSPFSMDSFETYEEAYHELMKGIIDRQIVSTNLVLKNTNVKHLYVDGGFAQNPVYMNLLAQAFPELEVFAANMSQATALGAALAIHHKWNAQPLPGDMIQVKQYKV